MELNEKLKKLRNDKNETQEYLAEEVLHIGTSTLKTYEKENAVRKPDIETLKKIKEHYNVSYEYLLDNGCENAKIENIEIGKELHLSDKSIEKIKSVSTINYFNDYINDKQKNIISKINSNIEIDSEEYNNIVNHLNILRNSNKTNTFNFFIENFNQFQEYIRKLSELNNLIEIFKNTELLKSVCSIYKVIENLVYSKKGAKLNDLINYYDEKLEKIQILSLGTVLNSSIMRDKYQTVKEDVLKNNLKQIQEDLEELNSEILQFIRLIIKNINCCKYEITELLNQYYNDLMGIARNDIYIGNQYKDTFIKNMIDENQKLLGTLPKKNNKK